MPLKSQAQSRAMHAAEAGHSTLGIPKAAAKSFLSHSQHGEGSLKGLPAHVKKRQRGGEVEGARKGNGAYLVGEKGPEIFVPRHRGAIVPNDEVRKLGEKYSKRQGGGPVEPDTPQAGFQPPRKQVEGLQRRGIISNRAKERRLGARPGASRHGYAKGETETAEIDAASR